MLINIHSHGLSITHAIRERVDKRIRFALSRISHRLRRVDVRLSDLNGPRGGVDKRCLIEVRINRHPPVIVTDVQSDLYRCVDRASARAQRTVLRRLSLDNRRHHPAAIPQAY
ncbi:MAG: HPF/RaiA family ribosome-associated protein [Halobacteria archaeon]|nr:HPF/RaiA family ribosome-associated protein [Halobacteria archaeon]